MKTAMIALLALACSGTVWAGEISTAPLPDAGSSLLLLGMGVTVVGLVRRAFRR
jgi:hypothetical protein